MVLPFGLSSAPYIFTKILKPLEKHCRYQGICVVVFVRTKDGLGKGLSSVQHCIVADSVKTDLYRAGFVTNKNR